MNTADTTPDIDLSAGFIPKPAPLGATTTSPMERALRAKAQRKAPTQDIDLSAGFIPKPVSLSSADVEFEDPSQKPSTGVPQLSSSDVEFEKPEEAEKPGFLKGVYDTTAGAIESAGDLANREEDYLRKNSGGFSRTPQAGGEFTPDEGDPLVQAIHGIVKSHADVAHKALEALRNAGAGYGRAFRGAAHGDLNAAGAEAQNAGEELSKGAGYGLATALPVLGPAAAKAGEDIGKDDIAYGLGEGTGLAGSVLAAGGGKASAERPEPIPGAPLTPGEIRGPGVVRSGEQLMSKVGSAQKPVREFMGDRTTAINNAARQVAPMAATPEETGATVQDAARAVTHGKEQSANLVGQFTDRATQDLDTAKENAADSEKAQTQAEGERQGTELQKTAAQELDRRRVAGITDAQGIAKGISGGHDELPVPESDRKIIDSLRSGNQEAKAEESAAHESLTEAAKARGIVVDTKPMQEVAKGVVQLEGPARDLVTSSLPASVLKMLEKASEGEAANSPLDPYAEAMTGHNYVELKGLVDSPPTGKAATRGAGGTYWSDALAKVEAEAAKDGIQPMEAGVPYDIMKTGRTAVRESLQGARKHFQQTGMGGNAVRVLQELYGSMSDAMKKSLEPHADLTEQFNKANALTVDRTSKFVDPKFIRSLVYKEDSAKVVGAVMRSGGQVEANALVNALGKDSFAMGRLKRAAMDFTLRRSMKSPGGELPGTVEASKMDYDLAVRNAEKMPALHTILGDDGYQKFLGELEKKRLAARDPEEVRFEANLQRIVKADMPEKAAKLGTDRDVVNKLTQSNPGVSPRPTDTATGARAVSWAERRLAGARSASERLNSPTLPEKGVQKVARGVAEEIAPSKIIESAAKSPEYTDKLLEVVDRSPNPQQVREQLGQRIFRNATDDAMVNGAFGSNDGVFDVGKFAASYRAARPSLVKFCHQKT
jgi:hypothetical protein